MKIEYYLFAFFVFSLLCIIMILARALFGNVKKQKSYLDEKEENLIKLYRDVEDLVNDLYDKMTENAAEFQRLESLRVVRNKAVEMKEDEVKKTAPPAPFLNISEKAPVPEPRIGNITETIAPPAVPEPSAVTSGGVLPQTAAALERRKSILEKLESGLPDRQIADDLNITLSEVKLVKGLYRSSSQANPSP